MDAMDIERLALLARLHLGEEERKRYQADLQKIIGYVDELTEIDTVDIEPVHHLLGLTNVLRGDDERTLRTGDGAAKLIAMVPKSKDGFVIVPRVLYHDAEL